MLLCRWDNSGSITTDPPQNTKFRHNAYYAVAMMIEGKKKAKERYPLPACVMRAIRVKYPDESYTGYKEKNKRHKPNN